MTVRPLQMPQRVRVVEVGPRDGLQNESVPVSADEKVRFVERLAAAGLRDIEVSSFVSPKRVPQLADAAEVFGKLTRHDGVRYSALVPNRQGLERALAAGVQAVALFTAASETFTQHNIGLGIAESLAVFREMMPTARDNGLWVRAYVSMAFVCPYEGMIDPVQVVRVVKALVDLGVDEISLGDTIGRATPDQVSRLTDAIAPVFPLGSLAYHFHDTYGAATANVQAALRDGVAIFDSSAGGLGGCPFAPGSPGNLATETLVRLLDSLEIETGVDAAKVAEAARLVRAELQ